MAGDMLAKLDSTLANYPIMTRLQVQTGVKRSYLAIGGVFALSFFLFFGLGAHFVANLVGFAYPAYASFKAIESKSLEDDKQWLTYWVVFAALTLLETFSSFILYWFPPYFALKLAFLLYLQLPQTQGARFVYTQVLAPFLRHSLPDGGSGGAGAPVAEENNLGKTS